MTPDPMLQSIEERLREATRRFDERLPELFDEITDVPDALREAMRYSMLAPGKRLRPYLVTRCHALCGGDDEHSWHLAVAIECVHVFTLIHDDLPCMDDAELRRGQPANHKVHGEAMAVLAGDALLALALELAARPLFDAEVIVKLVADLTRAVGWQGVIGGQVSDITASDAVSRKAVHSIHRRKTAALIECACRLGARAAGADALAFKNLGNYGLHLGLAFQIADDLLDIIGESSQTGKLGGIDARHEKATLPAIIGVDDSRRVAVEHRDEAIAALASWGSEADDLRALAGFVVQRRH